MTSDCIIWAGAIGKNGYGRVGRNGTAHRAAWEREHGPIPRGLCVCHACDVRSCVNVAHMFLGTHRDNSLDMVSKGRHGRYNALKTHCTNGHEFTEANTQVRPNGERRCRACGADYARRKRA